MVITNIKCGCGFVCQVAGSEIIKVHGGDEQCCHNLSLSETKSKTFDYYCSACCNFFQFEPKHICPKCGLIGTIKSRKEASKSQELTIEEQLQIMASKIPIIVLSH
jgi:hypothetical protein